MIKNKKYNIVSGNGDINFFVITKITLDKLKRMFLERLKHNKVTGFWMTIYHSQSSQKKEEKGIY